MPKEIKNSIWYEKYRHKRLSDMVLEKQQRAIFSRYIKKGDIPHLLFYGPVGGGKTTTAHILMGKCAGRKLILNAASSDRSINVINTRVINFARLKKKGNKRNVIFLDEANGLTPQAQEALKNIIEQHQNNCRFIFATNEFEQITDKIKSCCTMFQFSKFPIASMIDKMYDVLDEEEIDYKKKDVKTLVKKYYPDFRTVMNFAQVASFNGRLNLKSIKDQGDTQKISKLMRKGKITSIREILSDMTDFTWLYRYLFNEWILENLKPNDMQEAAILIPNYMYKSHFVVDKEITMSACIIELIALYGTDIDWRK